MMFMEVSSAWIHKPVRTRARPVYHLHVSVVNDIGLQVNCPIGNQAKDRFEIILHSCFNKLKIFNKSSLQFTIVYICKQKFKVCWVNTFNLCVLLL